MASATKRRKTEPFHRPGKTGECARQLKTTPSPGTKVGKVPTSSSGSPVVAPAPSTVDSKVQQAKKFAVAQAQRDGCTGNFRSFNSHFGLISCKHLKKVNESKKPCSYGKSNMSE